MKIQGFEVPVSNFVDQVWLDDSIGIIHLEYIERRMAVIERNKLIRAKFNRVTAPKQIKGETNWEITIPHPGWEVLNPMEVTGNCTPKGPSGPKDSLQKHTFGDVIKQELTDEEIIEREEKYKGKRRNLTPQEIEELTFLHQALAGGQIAPSKQYSMGKIPPIIDKEIKGEKVLLPQGENSPGLETFLKQNPEYIR